MVQFFCHSRRTWFIFIIHFISVVSIVLSFSDIFVDAKTGKHPFRDRNEDSYAFWNDDRARDDKDEDDDDGLGYIIQSIQNNIISLHKRIGFLIPDFFLNLVLE